MLKLIQPITTVEELYKSHGAPTGEIIVDAVVEYVKNMRDRSVTNVAEYFGQDSVILSGAIKMLVGVTLQEFIIQWRVLQALDLLDDPSLSVAEIARRTGFKCEKNFVQTLRRRVGVTPYAYRNDKVPRNGTYSFNRDPKERKKFAENLKQLKASRQKPVENPEQANPEPGTDNP